MLYYLIFIAQLTGLNYSKAFDLSDNIIWYISLRYKIKGDLIMSIGDKLLVFKSILLTLDRAFDFLSKILDYVLKLLESKDV